MKLMAARVLVFEHVYRVQLGMVGELKRMVTRETGG